MRRSWLRSFWAGLIVVAVAIGYLLSSGLGERLLHDEIETQLTRLLQGSVEIGEVKVRVEGHTDSRGNDARNLDLSQRRANSVMEYLVSHGVDASRLEAVGYGETRPLVENARTRAELAQNRRVVFTILDAEALAAESSAADEADAGGAEAEAPAEAPAEEAAEEAAE